MAYAYSMILLGHQHEAVHRRLDAQLQRVNHILRDELRSELDCVNDLSHYIERYHGKMLRPTLVLLSGLAVAPGRDVGEEHHTLAAVCEMVHLATLVHDDILDEADLRRRAATVNAMSGTETALMLGDYLISHAYHLCSSLDSQQVARSIAAATNTVCEGELLQLSNRYNWALDEPTYFQIIRRKTGALCGVCCRLGATLSGADASLADAMHRFGEYLGVAFQIIDDVLDLTGEPAVVGKSLHKDIEKGKLTLPLIRHMADCAIAERQRMIELLDGGGEGRTEAIVTRLNAGKAVAYARRRAEGYIDQARRQLDLLPAGSARDSLAAMAEAIIKRQF